MHEIDILRMLSGIADVVQLVNHWDVMYGAPEKADCTKHIRGSTMELTAIDFTGGFS